MPGNLVKSVMLKIQASDGDTEAKLDRISEKADELARKHPDLKVKIDTGAASAKLAVLRRELKDTADQGDKTGITFKGLASDVAEMATGLGAGSGAVGEMSMLQKVLLGLNVATGLGEPLMAGLTVAVGGLSSGLVSAGAGLGAFGLLAKVNLSAASAAASAAQKAQTTYTSAVTAANASYRKQMSDATTATERQSAATARASAIQAAYKARVQATSEAYANLSPEQVKLSKDLAAISGQWQKFSASFAGPTATVVGQVRPLITELLPDVRKLAMAGEAGISSMLSVLSSKGTSGLNRFVSMLANNAPEAIMRLGIAIGHIVTGIGGILRAFMPASHDILAGLDDITGKFAKWGSTLSGHSGFQSLMAMFKSETPLAMNALKQLGGIIKTVVAQMTGMSTFSNSKMLLQLAVPILKLVNALLKAHPQLVWLILYLKLAADGGKKLKAAFDGVSGAFAALSKGKQALSDLSGGFSSAETAASDASGAWGTMGGKLSTVLTKLGLMKAAQVEATVATEGETAAQGELDVAMDANPIGLIIVAVAALAAGIYELAKHSAAFRDFWKAAWKDIQAVAMAVFHVLEPALKVYADLWKVEWDIVKTVSLAAFRILEDAAKLWVKQWVVEFDLARDAVKFAFSLITDYIRINVNAIKAVLSWFGRLGSLFLGWFMDAANAVYAGTQRILSFVRALPGRILGALANLGSLLFGAGVNAIEGFIHGMGSMLGEVENVAESIGKSALHGVESFLHIGSPSKLLYDRGVMAAKGFELGIGAGTSGVESAARKMAAAVAGGTGAAAGGSGGINLTLEVHAPAGAAMLPAQFWTEFMNGIRAKGGSPAIVLKKVKFA
jgi:hypothetical protein